MSYYLQKDFIYKHKNSCNLCGRLIKPTVTIEEVRQDKIIPVFTMCLDCVNYIKKRLTI